MAEKTALFIVEQGSKELELAVPVNMLRYANVTVTIADSADSIYVTDESNQLTKTNVKLNNRKKFDAIVVLGLPSFKAVAESQITRRMVNKYGKCGVMFASFYGDMKSNGPEATVRALEFGLYLLKSLLGNELRDKIAKIHASLFLKSDCNSFQ